MFGFSWGEIGLIMAVALVAIGPKDLPIAIKTVTGLVKKARGVAAEFQGHLDELMREADLADIKTEINKVRKFDFRSAAENTIDPDGTLRATAKEVNQGISTPVTTPYTPPAPVEEELPDAPAMIPPDAARKLPVPAFIPPGTRRWGF